MQAKCVRMHAWKNDTVSRIENQNNCPLYYFYLMDYHHQQYLSLGPSSTAGLPHEETYSDFHFISNAILDHEVWIWTMHPAYQTAYPPQSETPFDRTILTLVVLTCIEKKTAIKLWSKQIFIIVQSRQKIGLLQV